MHFCNTFFEMEIESQIEKSLLDWLGFHFMVNKLQYLPLKYIGKKDIVLVSHLPENPDPRLHRIDRPPLNISSVLETWGASPSVQKWASSHGIPYKMPPWEVVKEVNSKVFSFQSSPKLEGSVLLTNRSDVEAWIEETPGPKVLKTPQGFAGRGHFHVGTKDLRPFLQKHSILIGEPWVKRTFDFSTQWKIESDSIEYLGSTILKTKEDGTYSSNIATSDFGDYNWALCDHLEIAKPILQKIQKLGYFGNLGIDAFVYLKNGGEKLHPIVEINARKTMGWVALQIQKNNT